MTPAHRSSPASVVVLAATAALALTLTGCSSSSKPAKTKTTPSSPTSSSNLSSTADGTAASDQLKSTLINAGDITIDKFALDNTSPVSQMGAVGISGVFANATHDRVVSVILIRYPSLAFSQAGLSEIQTLAAGQLTHNPASDTGVKVGDNAHLYVGANDTGPLSILVFGEGDYNVTMEFVSKKPGDSVPDSVVLALGAKQDAKIKAAK